MLWSRRVTLVSLIAAPRLSGYRWCAGRPSQFAHGGGLPAHPRPARLASLPADHAAWADPAGVTAVPISGVLGKSASALGHGGVGMLAISTCSRRGQRASRSLAQRPHDLLAGPGACPRPLRGDRHPRVHARRQGLGGRAAQEVLPRGHRRPRRLLRAGVRLGKAVLDAVLWPTWLYLIEFVWLFAMWLYYFIRFMTGQRSGPGRRRDAPARRRSRGRHRPYERRGASHDRRLTGSRGCTRAAPPRPASSAAACGPSGPPA